MNFWMISSDGDGLGIARRILDEGHSIQVTIKNPKAKDDYTGLLRKTPKIPDLNQLPKDTIFLFDSTAGGKTAERFKAYGFPVLGASHFAQQLEMDRHLALGLMRDAGIQVPPSQHFMDWESGRKHVETKAERMVYKSDDNGGTSYVSSGPEDMLEFLNFQEKDGQEKPDFELQDFVKGLEISTEVWFDGVDYARPINHTFEKKQLMNGDIGPSSGCAGNVVWACQEPYCRICEEGIKRFIPMLRYHQYRGMIDLNAIVNEQGCWGLEWTPRFGFDAFPSFMEMLTEGVGDTLARYAKGERIAEFPMASKGFAAGIRVTIPPYPYEKDNEVLAAKGIAIRELVRADRAHAYFYNVLLDGEGQLRTSGGFGAIAVFTSFADTIHDAFERCEEICKRVDLRDKMYRTDLGSIFDEDYRKFQEMAIAQSAPEPAPVESMPVMVMAGGGENLNQDTPSAVPVVGYEGEPRDGMQNRKS